MLPCPSLRPDGAILRDNDSFVRKDGKFENHVVFDISYPLPLFHDSRLRQKINEHPDINILRESSVIVIVNQGQADEGFGNGALVSPNLVLTCQHIFNDNDVMIVVYRDVSISAKVLAIQRSFFPPQAAAYLSDGEGPIDFDACLLQLASPIFLDQYLQIPESLQHVEQGAPICSFGYPGLPPPNISYSDCFTGVLAELNHLSEDQYESMYRKTFYDFCEPIVAFGSFLGSESVGRNWYLKGSFSSCFGMSGSPLVSLDSPSELLGIVEGGRSSCEYNIFLDTTIEPIRKSIAYYKNLYQLE